MTFELMTLLGFAVILLMTIMIQSMLFTMQNGLAATLGSRDELSANGGRIEPRLQRAVRNSVEAMAIYAPLVLVAHALGVSNQLTTIGAGMFIVGRTLFPILYAFGAVPFRTISWSISIFGIMVFGFGLYSQVSAMGAM